MKDIAVALGADVTGLSTEEAANRVLEIVVDLNKSLNIP